MNKHILSVREALHQGARSGEKQLVSIGHNHGDDKLAILVQELTTPEIIVMTDDSDMTGPSILSAFVTPDQFLATLEKKAIEWGHFYGSMTVEGLSEVLVVLQEKIEDFICPMIYSSGAEEREAEMINTLLGFEYGADIIFIASIGRKDFAALLTAPTSNAVRQGTWQSLLASLYHKDPSVFEELSAHFVTFHPEVDEQLASVKFAHEILLELSKAFAAPENEGKKKPDQFITF